MCNLIPVSCEMDLHVLVILVLSEPSHTDWALPGGNQHNYV